MPGKGGFRLAPSAARVVCEYYTETSKPNDPDGAARLAFLNSQRMRELLEETDKIDAGKLTREDVLSPQGYVLISMTTDGRNAGDEPYWLRVIELLRDETLENMLNDSEVKRRCQQILDEQEQLRKILLQHTTLKGNVIFADLRGIDKIPDGNRFLVFTLFPKGNIQVKVANDTQRVNTTSISVGTISSIRHRRLMSASCCKNTAAAATGLSAPAAFPTIKRNKRSKRSSRPCPKRLNKL